MGRTGCILMSCMLMCWLGDAVAAARDAAKPPAVLKTCQKCHGENGVSVDIRVPKLAGQFAEYIVKQIVDFQTQNRSDERMTQEAQKLTTLQDIRAVAAYFAAQPMSSPRRTKTRNYEFGKTIYMSGIPERRIDACVGCHGADGRGDAKSGALIPKIAGQHKQYVIKQFEDFRTARRNTDPTGIMANIGKHLQPDELEAVVDYVAGL